MTTDALISRQIPALYNGVSQQNPTLRQASQGEAQVNMYGTVMDGLRKRPPAEHIAQITVADISAAFIHTINRDLGERYVVVVTDGDLKVYDVEDGTEKTVNFPTGKTYLDIVGGGDANVSFALDTIADYTFLVNKTVVTATQTSPTATPTNYDEFYSPPVWREQVPARYYNPGGAGSLTGTVNTFSDLPGAEDASPPSNGQIYKVVGYDENNFGGYYVKRVGGVWEEWYGIGANLGFDEDTMPHALVRLANGEFDFVPFAFTVRQYGDAETNPPPTFVGRTINGVFYWKNRLGFITDENVVFSGAGDYGNFWRNTMTTLLDSDVVDVALTTNKVSILNYALPFNDTMMLFSDQGQFSLNVRDVLTPTSVSIEQATGYEMDIGVKPVALGSEIYFVSTSGAYSRLREYFVQAEQLSLGAADITAHVQRYVPSDIFKLAGNSIEDVVFAISSKTGERNRIYVYKFFWSGDEKVQSAWSYKFFWSGDEKVQSAWSYWQMGDDDIILSIDTIEDELYVLVKRSDGTYLEKIDIDVNATTLALDWNILLDRRYEIQTEDMTYSAGQDRTTIDFPFEITEDDDMKIILTAGEGNEGKLLDPTEYVFPLGDLSSMTVPGDITALEPVGGVNYDANYTFSEQFVFDSNGSADTTGRLQMRTFTVNYRSTGFFSTEVYPYGTDFSSDEEDVVTAALDAFTGRTLGEASLITGEAAFHTGVYQFYIDGNSRDIVVKLHNNSHLPSQITSVEWEGFWTKRAKGV